MEPVLVIGAGCAGLASAYRLSQEARPLLLIERSDKIGGLSETICHQGVRFDLGPHIFFKNDGEISALWHNLLKEKLVTHQRRSSIYYEGKLIESPLSPLDALKKIGLGKSLGIFASYLKSQFYPSSEARNAREWVTNHFGEKLYQMFYEVYNEKIWGVNPEQIEPLWAKRRIKNTFFKMILGAFLNDPKFTAKEFDYPEEGSSMMHQAFLEEIFRRPEAKLKTSSEVAQLHHNGKWIEAVKIWNQGSGQMQCWEGGPIISSIPLDELVRKMAPSAPQEVLDAANTLVYRDLITVNLIVDLKHLNAFQEHWVDVHAAEIKMLRVTNFGNFSRAMCANNKAGLCVEYVCSPGDDLWTQSDKELVSLATRELETMRLIPPQTIEDGLVVRRKKAYAVYLLGYLQKIKILRDYLGGFQNLQTIGRQGMFVYNNMHHSVRTGILAAENILGASYDLWNLESVTGPFAAA